MEKENPENMLYMVQKNTNLHQTNVLNLKKKKKLFVNANLFVGSKGMIIIFNYFKN